MVERSKSDSEPMANLTIRIPSELRDRILSFAERKSARTGTRWNLGMAIRNLCETALNNAERDR